MTACRIGEKDAPHSGVPSDGKPIFPHQSVIATIRTFNWHFLQTETRRRSKAMLNRNNLKIALICSVFVGLSQYASALPKQGTGKCRCTCVAPSGIGGQLWSDNVYNSNGYSCGAFQGKTCNIENPNTGGIATGEIIGCETATSSRRSIIEFNPITGGQLVPRRR